MMLEGKMNIRVQANKYSASEEIANSVTHGIGALLSICGLVALIVFASRYGGTRDVIANAIFGLTLIFSYFASTFYHAVSNIRTKKTLKVVDHIAIYFLIAGTYTPFTLISLRGAWGWSLFVIIWGLAFVGVILKLTMLSRIAKVSTLVYLLMGWIILIAIKPLLAVVAPQGMLLLLSGGVAYSIGVVFYVWKTLPYSHAIWHLFVLAGSLFHFLAIFYYVIPSS
jgi:hemolysin III